MPPLTDDTSASLLGYTAHLLIKAAESEVAAGVRGSKAVRLAALEALTQLIQALGGHQGCGILAYLLPGLVSGLGKQLLALGTFPAM